MVITKLWAKLSFFYQKSIFRKNSREFSVQYGAVILRSQSVTVIFRMTYECHTSLAHCHCTHPAPLPQESLSRSPSVSGCLLRLTGARGRETALIVSVLQTGGPWAGWAAVSQRSPASLSGLPLTPTARVDPADLFHS